MDFLNTLLKTLMLLTLMLPTFAQENDEEDEGRRHAAHDARSWWDDGRPRRRLTARISAPLEGVISCQSGPFHAPLFTVSSALF